MKGMRIDSLCKLNFLENTLAEVNIYYVMELMINNHLSEMHAISRLKRKIYNHAL